jgi:hypothetical protein
VFKRNPNYYRDGQPYVDGVEWLVINDDSTGLAMYRTGQLDCGPGINWAVRQQDLEAFKKSYPQLIYQDFLSQTSSVVTMRTEHGSQDAVPGRAPPCLRDAHILHPGRDLLIDGAGGAEAARLAQALQPGRDVDPVAVEALPVRHGIPQVDANANLRAVVAASSSPIRRL